MSRALDRGQQPIAPSALGTGTPGSGNFLRGDGAWEAVQTGPAPGDFITTYRALSAPAFLSPGTYLKADYPLLSSIELPSVLEPINTGFNAGTNNSATGNSSGVIFVGGNDPAGLTVTRRSTDGGATWASMNTGINNSLFALRLADNGVGLAIGSDSGFSALLRRTTNSGATWATVSTSFGVNSIRSVDTDGNGVWIIVGNNGLAARSTDDGATFTSISVGYSTNIIRSVVYGGGNTWLLAGVGGVIRRSTDNGVTWSTATRAAGTCTISNLATDGNGTWITVCSSPVQTDFILRSTDSGATFTNTNVVGNDLFFQGGPIRATFVDGKYYVVGFSSLNGSTVEPRLYESTTGIAWEEIFLNISLSNSVGYIAANVGNNKLFVGGSENTSAQPVFELLTNPAAFTVLPTNDGTIRYFATGA